MAKDCWSTLISNRISRLLVHRRFCKLCLAFLLAKRNGCRGSLSLYVKPQRRAWRRKDVPPWRRAEYVKSKWMSPYVRGPDAQEDKQEPVDVLTKSVGSIVFGVWRLCEAFIYYDIKASREVCERSVRIPYSFFMLRVWTWYITVRLNLSFFFGCKGDCDPTLVLCRCFCGTVIINQ